MKEKTSITLSKDVIAQVTGWPDQTSRGRLSLNACSEDICETERERHSTLEISNELTGLRTD